MNNEPPDSEALPPASFCAIGSEKRIVGWIIAAVILLTTMPYILAFSVSSTFVGQIYNIVDYSVYLSWTRQAADGHFSNLNLFTTIKQHGYLFNALFLILGNIVRFTKLPIPIVFQLVRIGGAVVLLSLAYQLCGLAYPNSRDARLTALSLIAFSSGFGFLYWPRWADNNNGSFPVDVWQPEAFTFLSIYTSVLFVIATIFILTAFYNLVKGELTGKTVYGVYAGLCGLILGNIHSYDILQIAAAWGCYLVVISIIELRLDTGRWLRAFIAGALSLPTTLYQYWVFKHEPVFRLRALTPTLSPPLFYYMMGYGLVFFLALGAIGLIVANKKELTDLFRSRPILVWVVSWALAGLTIIYLPVEFQRKMAMGEQIPLCILAGGCAAYLVAKVNENIRPYALGLLVLLTFPSNALFLARDVRHVEFNRSEIAGANPFLSPEQIDVLHWLRDNTQPGEAVLALPPIGQFVPGYCDRAVWVGHWSETPRYGSKIAKLMRMLSTATPDDEREAFLLGTGTTYLVYPTVVSGQGIPTKHGYLQLEDFADFPPPYLTPVYQTRPASGSVPGAGMASSYTIFKING